MQAQAFALRHFKFHYGSTLALHGEQAMVPLGSRTAIVGPNGAGKSTLLKALASLLSLRYDEQRGGNGEVLGMALPLSTRKQRLRVAYLAQDSTLVQSFPITAFEVVLMGCYGRLGWLRRPTAQLRQQAMECLQQLDIRALSERRFGELSGGQRQRVLLARALLQDAELYLMDEPLSGVDAVSAERLGVVWRQLQAQGKTVIAVHHELSTLREYFNHVMIVNRGILGSGALTRPLAPKLRAALKKAYAAYELKL